MSESSCLFEAAVIEATRTHGWSDALRAHVCECSECSETARVTAWIGDAALRLGRDQPAPDSTYIWLRAEVERRAKEGDYRSSFRLRVTIVLGLAAGLACTALLFLVLPAIAAVIGVVRSSMPAALTETSLFATAALGATWLASPLLLAAAVLFLLRPLR